MTRLTVTWSLFTIAVTINQITARDFIRKALQNVLAHQAQNEQVSDKSQTDYSDDAGNPHSHLGSYSVGPALYLDDDDGVLSQKQRDDSNDDISLPNLKSLIELALDDEVSKQDKILHRKKQAKKRPQLEMLNAMNLDVMNKNSGHEKRKSKFISDVLGASKTRGPVSDEDSQTIMIIDSDALQGGSEEDSTVNDLLSALLKLSSASNKDRSRSALPPEYRYKGFRVKVPRGTYRKARGDSNEKYVLADDDEMAPPIKRPRSYAGKGRTAIPYIRNRGDIYEKDY